MKKKVAQMIRIMGIGLYEIVITLETSVGVFDSIEYDKQDNKIYLHMFVGKDLDIMYDFDDLTKDDKNSVYITLASILYN
jgi:hypothetical protein